MLDLFRKYVVFLAFSICLVVVSGDKARASGEELVLYTSMPLALAQKTLAGFKEVHPDSQVILHRDATTRLVAKLLAEKRAGHITADVVMVADEPNMEVLKSKGLLLAYRDAPVKGLPEESYHEAFLYFGTKIMSTVLVYHTGRSKPLKSWRALLEQPEGQVVMADPMTSGSAQVHLSFLVQKLGWEYYETLAMNGARVLSNNGAVLKALLEGKAAYGMMLDYMVANAKRKGQPVDMVYPEEGVAALYQPIALVNSGKNLPAAKAFVNFMLSKPGLKLASELGYRSLDSSIASPVEFPPTDAVRLETVKIAQFMKQLPKTKDTFDALFGR